MKLSYNWLKEFVDIKVTPDQLAKDLNSFGHEVEEVKKVGDDYVLDLSITANRGDCLSVLGMAREVAAFYNLKLKTKNENLNLKSSILNHKLKVTISNLNICPRYSVRIIDDIKVKESSKWIQDRLKLVGFRPINNIVDITNYVMLETGQPLHAFDYNKIHDRKMNIRLAEIGESVITLDGKSRELDENSIIIEDGKKIFDLAGIMGGTNSEVDKNTKTIVLQAAIFDKKLVRFTSKRLKHMTDASYRYEREVDYNGTISALETATYFTLKDCPLGKISGIIDKKSGNWQPVVISWHSEQDVKRLLGIEIPYERIMEYLQRLDIGCLKCSLDKKDCQIQSPSWRHDLTISEDLVEEVARIYGYNKLGKNFPLKVNQRQSADKSAATSNQYVQKESLKNILVDNGFTEVYSYSFTDKKLMQLLGINLNNCRRVINSVAPELEYLRYDLRPSILSAVAKNPWAPEIKIFEIGKVFNADGEKWQLGIATTEKSSQDIEKVISLLQNNSLISVNQRINQRQSAERLEGNFTHTIGKPQVVNQNTLNTLKIRRPVRYAIIDLDEKILKNVSVSSVQSNTPRGWAFDSREVDKVKYHSISSFPPTIRDLAFIVNKDVTSELIRSHIVSLDFHILLVELFDEFHFPSATSANNQRNLLNMKNIAYHIWLQDLTKPMDLNKVDDIINKIIKSVESKFDAKLRACLITCF